MSTLRIEKAYYDRSESLDAKDKSGRLKSVEIPYIVFGVETERDAIQALKSKGIEEIQSMLCTSISTDERLASDIFKIVASYEPDPDWEDPSGGGSDTKDEKQYSISFEIGGGTQHISHSIETVQRVPHSAPHLNGAINFDGQNVNGLDIAGGGITMTETVEIKAVEIDAAFVKSIAEKQNKLNHESFRGFNPGEVLFLGATLSQQGTGKTAKSSISYKFQISMNSTVKAGSESVEKKGFEYAWVKYKPALDTASKTIGQEVEGLYVEKVYDSTSFSGLGGE